MRIDPFTSARIEFAKKVGHLRHRPEGKLTFVEIAQRLGTTRQTVAKYYDLYLHLTQVTDQL